MHLSNLFAHAAACLLLTVAHAEVESFPVVPAETDHRIQRFNAPHRVFVDGTIVGKTDGDRVRGRRQLLLWLTGTGGKPQPNHAFAKLAASLGYHVVSLMYPDDIPATACGRDRDPDAFEAFRMAIIEGGRAAYQDGRKKMSIERHESIDSRLIKLLQYLQEKRPDEGWEQFLGGDGTIKWESIAVAGQSQGGGHAALIGIKRRVARVICFGSPKDYSKRHDAPAAWYGQNSATPKDRFFAFNHHQDPKGCTPEQLLANLEALGLDAFGAPAEVDSEPFPYRHARILYTSYPKVTVTGVESEGARIAHGSAIVARHADRWKDVWRYLLTE